MKKSYPLFLFPFFFYCSVSLLLYIIYILYIFINILYSWFFFQAIRVPFFFIPSLLFSRWFPFSLRLTFTQTQLPLLSPPLRYYQGCLDYLFCSKSTLVPLALLPIPSMELLTSENTGGLPNSVIPSDHLPLGARFRFL